jgi:hypothetical protein
MKWLDSLLRFQLLKRFINNSVVTQSWCENRKYWKDRQADIFYHYPPKKHAMTIRQQYCNKPTRLKHNMKDHAWSNKEKGVEREKKRRKIYIEWTRDITFFFFFLSTALISIYIYCLFYTSYMYSSNKYICFNCWYNCQVS